MSDSNWFSLPPAPPAPGSSTPPISRASRGSIARRSGSQSGLRPINSTSGDSQVSNPLSTNSHLYPPPPSPHKGKEGAVNISGIEMQKVDLPSPPQRKKHYHKALSPPPKPVKNRPHKKPLLPKSELQHDHRSGKQCLACLVDNQTNSMEAMRHQLAHAKSESDTLRKEKTRLEAEQPQSPASQVQHEATLQGVGDSLAFHKEQIRQLKFTIAQSEASQANTEELLREALQRPPLPPPVPIRDSGAQTSCLEGIDIIVNGERADSEETSSDEEAIRAGRRQAGLDPATKHELISKFKHAVGIEVNGAIQRAGGWLFGQPATAARELDEALKDDGKTSFLLPRLPLDPLVKHNIEEIFYEICASVGEAHAISENQAIQVHNARDFDTLRAGMSLNLSDEIVTQIEDHDVLRYLCRRVSPIYYCNNPLGFVLTSIVESRDKANRVAKLQEYDQQAIYQGLAGERDRHLGDSAKEDRGDEPPNPNQWTDLAKRLIIMLSRHTECLVPQIVLFDYSDPLSTGPPQKFAPLQFAVEKNLDEVVLQLCDAQERLPVDYWETSYGYPFHTAADNGEARDNSMRYMLRSAAVLTDDRFGLLKVRANDGGGAFYPAVMHAAEVSGVIDMLMDILLKHHFKLNLDWKSYTYWEPREEWHLLQWAAYQGIDRVFKQTRTHPTFLPKCAASTDPDPQASVPPRNNTALHLACMTGSYSVVSFLLEQQSGSLKDANCSTWTKFPTPLHLAAQQCHWKCIEKILLFAKDKWQWSPEVSEQKLFGTNENKANWLIGTDAFDYTVYTISLLALVQRRHRLATETDASADDDQQRSNDDMVKKMETAVEVSYQSVKNLNEMHPAKLRTFAKERIRRLFIPWLIFIGLVTFFAASENGWMGDFNFNSSLALQRHFETISYTTPEGVEKRMENLDNQDELIEWMATVLEHMPQTFEYTHTIPVGSTRVRQVVIANNSCDIIPTFFRRTQRRGNVAVTPCSGSVSAPRTFVLFNWMFDLFLDEPRDKHTEYRDPLVLPNQVSLFKTESETQEKPYTSPLGYEYPGSGYVIDFDWGNDVSWRSNLTDFRLPLSQGGWLQYGTRGLFIAITLYNPATDYYISGNMLFELPPYGGVFGVTTWKSLRLFKHFSSGLDYFVFAVEILLGVIVAILAIRKFIEFAYILKGHFKGFTISKLPSLLAGAVVKLAGRGANLLDFVTIIAFVVVFALRFKIRGEANDLETLFESHSDGDILQTSFFFPFRSIADDHAVRQSIFGIVLMFVYMKILAIVKIQRDVGPISIAIVQTLFNMRILYFGIILVLLLFSLSLAAYFAYGEFAFEFRSLFTALLSMFRIIFGEYWEYRTVRREQSIYGALLLLFMLLFGSLLLINVLTAIIFDIYRHKNDESKVSWSTDLVDMQINEMMRTLHQKAKENQKSSHWLNSLLQAIQTTTTLNKDEVENVMEWNRTLVYAKMWGFPTLFPDPLQEHRALKSFYEEERTTDVILEVMNNGQRNLIDRVESMERSMKEIGKSVQEIHGRIFPKSNMQLQKGVNDSVKKTDSSRMVDEMDV